MHVTAIVGGHLLHCCACEPREGLEASFACDDCQSVYTTAATRAATWSTAPVYCPFRVNYKVHTQLTLLHYHTPLLLIHMD